MPRSQPHGEFHGFYTDRCHMNSLSILLSLALCGDQPGAAEPAASRDRDELTRFLWTGLKDNRERLRSGVFRARGRYVVDEPQPGRFEGDVQLFSAFDYDKDLLRFDRVEP